MIRKFPQGIFVRYPDGHPGYAETAAESPAWFVGQLREFAGLGPVAPTEVQFVGLPGLPYGEVAESTWFSWLPGARKDRLIRLPSGGVWVPIGYSSDARLALAVSATSHAPKAVHLIWLGEEDPAEVVERRVARAFQSFSTLLSYVSAVRLADGTVIEAKLSG